MDSPVHSEDRLCTDFILAPYACIEKCKPINGSWLIEYRGACSLFIARAQSSWMDLFLVDHIFRHASREDCRNQASGRSGYGPGPGARSLA